MMNLNQVVDNSKGNNIVGFKDESTASRVNMFLEETRERSENTYIAYKGQIDEFFMFVLGKEVTDISWEEIKDIGFEDMMRYKLHLGKAKVRTKKDDNGNWKYRRGQAPSTINSKIACIRALFSFFQKIDGSINASAMNVRRAEPTNENVSYGSLTEEEFESLLEFCDNEKVKPLTKRMFFEIALNTGMRKNAILDNMYWSNIGEVIDKDSGVEVKAIQDVEDKGGKRDLTPISDEFYSRLIKYKSSDEIEWVEGGVELDDNDVKVVSLNTKTVDSVLKRWKDSYGIEDSRNITIHSIKSTGCDIVWNKTKDIKAVSDYAHHSDINTAYKHYLGKNESLMDKASYFAFEDSSSDISELDSLSKEELIDLISDCSMSTISEIMSKIK